jgi:hypothetical protein
LADLALKFLLFEMRDVDMSLKVEAGVVDLATVGSTAAVLHH